MSAYGVERKGKGISCFHGDGIGAGAIRPHIAAQIVWGKIFNH